MVIHSQIKQNIYLYNIRMEPTKSTENLSKLVQKPHPNNTNNIKSYNKYNTPTADNKFDSIRFELLVFQNEKRPTYSPLAT